MAIAAGVPRPQIWIVDDPDPNAFATGTDPLHSHVAVTRGLLEICSRDELQAVVGHELGHIKNLDVRLMTLLAALVGAVALMHDGVSRGLRGGTNLGGGSWGGGGGSGGGGPRGGRERGGAGPLLPIRLGGGVGSGILSPIITALLAGGVERKRETPARATGAPVTPHPPCP